jgi:Fe-S cluster biogenesis protein NfuA
MAQSQDLRDVGQRVEKILAELGAAEPGVAEQAEELVRLLVELYGAGFERVLQIAGEADPVLVQRLSDDQLVSSLLVLHGIHPVPVEERVERSLASVRRGLGLNAGGLSLLGIDDEGVLHVRFEGSCSGCGSSLGAATAAVEEAIEQWAPELTGVQVEAVEKKVESAVPVSIGPRRRPGGTAVSPDSSEKQTA